MALNDRDVNSALVTVSDVQVIGSSRQTSRSDASR